MSDTKWRKLFEAIDASGLGIEQFVVKFVGSDEEKRLSSRIGLHPPRPWIETFQFGVTPIRAIEWLLIPRFAEYEVGTIGAPRRRVEQRMQDAEALITALGKYPVEMSERGLTVVGYLR